MSAWRTECQSLRFQGERFKIPIQTHNIGIAARGFETVSASFLMNNNYFSLAHFPRLLDRLKLNRNFSTEGIMLLNKFSAFLIFIVFASSSMAASTVYLSDLSIRRVVQTTNGDFIYIDKSLLDITLGCQSSNTYVTAFNIIYVPGAPDSPKSHLISGILAAFAAKKKIKLAAISVNNSPVYGVTDIGTTACFLTYADFEQ